MLLLLPVLFILERFYFSLSDRLEITDKPNSRSSHSHITRRGGGIIFPIAWMLFFVISGFSMPWFTVGLVLIAIVSFTDDLGEVAVLSRITTHAVALFLALFEFGITEILPFWGVALTVFCGIAVLNAVNFMDGINGILVFSGLVFWGVLAYTSLPEWNELLFDFSTPFTYIFASLLVFGFYNCRKKAVCFAGDVGSVTMAYLMIGAIVPLIFSTATKGWTSNFTAAAPVIELKYMLLLAVYGVDSVLTIIHRLMLRENILKGHRKHLYQIMANEAGIPHLLVATYYAAIQLVISIWVIKSDVSWVQGIILLACLSTVYTITKWYFMNRIHSRRSVSPDVEAEMVSSTVTDVPVLAADFDEAVMIPQSETGNPENASDDSGKDSKEKVKTAEVN